MTDEEKAIDNPLGVSDCYCCGKEYSEADDWHIFKNFKSPETDGVVICPDCLRETMMVFKLQDNNDFLREKLNNIDYVLHSLQGEDAEPQLTTNTVKD